MKCFSNLKSEREKDLKVRSFLIKDAASAADVKVNQVKNPNTERFVVTCPVSDRDY